MYTQTHRIKGPPKQDGAHNLLALPEEQPLPTVRLIAQNGNGQAVFAGPDGEIETMPASEFFATHREAGPAEMHRYEKAAKAHNAPPKEPAVAKT